MLQMLKSAGVATGMALCLVVAQAATQPAATAWTVETFDRPGGVGTQLWGINDAGQFVGSDSLGAFVVSNGVATDLAGPAGAVRTVPFGISNGGLVVGSWYGADAVERTFLFDGEQYTNFELPLVDVALTQIRGVSLDGRWLTGLYVDGSGVQNGFVFDLQTAALQLPTVPNAFTFMQGANSAGLAVGNVSPGGGLVFDTATGEQQVVANLAGFIGGPRFRGINDAGLISGFVSQQAIVGTLAGGFTALPMGGVAASFAEGLNNVGQVVGFFNDANGISHGFIASSVPEPASAAFLLAGLGLLGAVHRRRLARESDQPLINNLETAP